MFQNYYEVKITGKDVKRFLRKLYKSNIYFENIEIYEKYAYVKISKGDYLKLLDIKTIYKIEIVKLYGLLKIIDYIKKYYIFFISIFMGYLFTCMLSNIIFEVDVMHSKKEIRDLIYKELKYYEIDKYNFTISYNRKEKIKNKILEDNKEKIEWLEIERIGVKYEVRVEERIINKIKKDNTPRNIIAKKDGIITSIKASSGQIVKKRNDYVKKGDIVISGNIYKNEEIKSTVKADGIVYAEVWYKVSVDMPYHYEEVIYTNKSKKILKLSILNKDFYLFNFSKYKNYKEKDIVKIENDLLPVHFKYATSYEVKIIDEIYTIEEAIIKAKSLAIKKLKSSLKENDDIISSKVLTKNDNNDYLYIEFFFKVNEDITDDEKISNLKTP